MALIFAHRGACRLAPENTMPAFEAALAEGADGFELDAMCCAGGTVVVCHDHDLRRLANAKVRVDRLEYGDLSRFDVAADFRLRTRSGDGWLAHAQIPTLREVLETFGKRTFINVELKVEDARDTGLEGKVMAMLDDLDLFERVVVSSFHPVSLLRARHWLLAAKRRCELALLFSPGQSLPMRGAWLAGPLGVDALHPESALLTPALAARARARPYKLRAWTIDAPDEALRAIELGADAIITNEPGRLRHALATIRACA